VDDLTLQHADLDARLKNAHTEETRLLDLMSGRTGSVSDLLATERELARVQETIERLTAEKRAMNDSVEFATIHLTVSSPSTPFTQTPGKSIAHAWSTGVAAAHAIVVFVLMAVAALSPTMVPLIAFGALLVIVIRRVRRSVA
jgi:Flp pilus assembly protein TadB